MSEKLFTYQDEEMSFEHRHGMTFIYTSDGETKLTLLGAATQDQVIMALCGFDSGFQRGQIVGRENAQRDMQRALGITP